jgi:hypothetical protein
VLQRGGLGAKTTRQLLERGGLVRGVFGRPRDYRTIARATEDDADDAVLGARDGQKLDGGRARGGDALHAAERVEDAQHDACITRTCVWIFGQQTVEQRVEVRAQVGPQRAHLGRVLPQHLGQHCDVVLPAERGAAGEALVQHAAERKHVGAGVDVACAHRLLGRHVAHRTEHGARSRQAACARLVSRQAEVEQLRSRRVPVDQEHVARLEVAVDHAARVRERERATDTVHQHQALLDAQPAVAQRDRQLVTVEPLHRQERRATRREPVRDVTNDGGVRQLRQHRCLACKALYVVLARLADDLDGRKALGRQVFGFVDGAHAAHAGEALDQKTVGEQLARVEARGFGDGFFGPDNGVWHGLETRHVRSASGPDSPPD